MRLTFFVSLSVLLGVWSCTSTPETQKQFSVAPPAAPQAFQPYPIDSSKVDTLPSGLMIYIHRKGQGNLPKPGQQVIVHYYGQLVSGEKFDSSYDRGQPFSFPLGQGQVIRGWDEGIARLPVGSQAVLIVPPHLGYGERDMGVIPPNSTLVFYVEVLGTQ
jgi:peptidylprolyl isomerase